MDKQTLYALREMGKISDRYWYQLNGNSPQENFNEQRKNFLDDIYGDEDEQTNVVFTFESKVKK